MHGLGVGLWLHIERKANPDQLPRIRSLSKQAPLNMQAALDHLRQHQEITAEKGSRLSPLAHGHVNVLGDYYSFTLAEPAVKG